MTKRAVYLFLSLFILLSLKTTVSANNTRLIALTFDDGPCKNITPLLLDALTERNVHVSFFLVGRYVNYYPKIATRAAEEGHQLCNHSYSHPWFTKLSSKALKDELSKTNTLLSEITGKNEFMVRIPYGAISSTTKQLADAPLIQWSLDPANGNMDASEEYMKKNLVSSATDGAIVILHDMNSKNLNVALYAIDELLAQGYEFVTLDELFRLRGVTAQNGVVYYSVPAGEAETNFDESRLAEHWASSYIDFVVENEIMLGDGAGFKPNGYMTRAMAATILWRMAGSPAAENPVSTHMQFLFSADARRHRCAAYSKNSLEAPCFTDVPNGLWYSAAVSWAQENGCAKGVSESTFEPEAIVTKEQFYTMLGRYGKAALTASPSVLEPRVYRDDQRISPWASRSVCLFRESGFVSKNDREIFRPLDNITRAEAAELITWLLRDCPTASVREGA